MRPGKPDPRAKARGDADGGVMISSAFVALLITAFWAFCVFGPVPLLYVLGSITVMLPLWLLHDLGLSGLGRPENGFFEPTSAGYALGAFIIWAIWFVILIALKRRRSNKRQA